MRKRLIRTTFSVLVIFLACSCSHNFPKSKTVTTDRYTSIDLGEEGTVGQSSSGLNFTMGGFSGLQVIPELIGEQEMTFWTVTDRGPNAEPIVDPDTKEEVRPFLLPKYTPRIYKIFWDLRNSMLTVLDEILLKDSDGNPLTGLPNLPKVDEIPVGVDGKRLDYDLLGVDPEGIAQDQKGNFWVVEEYRPSLMKFDPEGKLIKRFVPEGAFSRTDLLKMREAHGRTEIVELLPAELNLRKKNRGFEGLAIKGNRLMLAMQSPLEIKDAKTQNLVRFFEFDIISEKLVATYLYPLTVKGADRIGDISWNDKGLFVIEQNDKAGASAVHQIQQVTNLIPFTQHKHEIPEGLEMKDLKANLLQKSLAIDLVKAGFSQHDKVEGLAAMPDGTFVVSTDNDFGIEKGHDSLSNIKVNTDKKPVLARFKR